MCEFMFSIFCAGIGLVVGWKLGEYFDKNNS